MKNTKTIGSLQTRPQRTNPLFLLIFTAIGLFDDFSDEKFAHFVLWIEHMIDSVFGIIWKVSANDKPKESCDWLEWESSGLTVCGSITSPSSLIVIGKDYWMNAIPAKKHTAPLIIFWISITSMKKLLRSEWARKQG